MEASPPSSAEQRLKLDDSDLECSVCNDLFTDPKLLPCVHVICRECLLTWFSTNHEATCPLCRCAIAEGKKGEGASKKEWEKVANALPDDVAMAALVENTRLLRGADHACVGCRQYQAVSVCLDCGDMLCEACTTTHRNLSATKNHKVECLATMTAMKLSQSQPASCSVHPDRPSELFCPSHGAAICHLCASSVHRTCPEVTPFEERLRALSDKLTEDSNSLLKAAKTLELEVNNLDSKLKDSEKITNRYLAEIDEACDRLQNSVNACRQRLKTLVLKASKEAEQSIQEAKFDLFTRRGQIASRRRFVDRVQLTSPPGKLEQASKMVQSFIQNIGSKSSFDVSVITPCPVHVDFDVVTRLENELAVLFEKQSLSENKMKEEERPREEEASRKVVVPVPDGSTSSSGSTPEGGLAVATRSNPNNVLNDTVCAWEFWPTQNAIISNNGRTGQIVTGKKATLMTAEKNAKGYSLRGSPRLSKKG